MISSWQAQYHNERGRKFLDKGDYIEAERQFRNSIRHVPTWSVPWFNLGLVFKRQRNWTESLACNQKAVDLYQDDVDAWWNLGIAATALRRWDLARSAWKSAGIHIPEGTDELRMTLPLNPIRLNPETRGEIVWCERIDPARNIILSVPLPESGHRFGDHILQDGPINGYRLLDGKEVPVFDELERLEKSDYLTFDTQLKIGRPEDLKDLEDLVEKSDVGMENWSRTRFLIKECSENRPHEHHDGYPRADSGEIRVGFASKTAEELHHILSVWTGRGNQRTVLKIQPPDDGTLNH
jgi:tetratricopeptide (TPR) repeat protein